MSFFKKLKKVFKTIVNIVTAPLKAVISVAAKVVAPVLRVVAEVEGLVYNGLKQATDAVSVGPSWIRNLASRLSGIAYDSAMFSSRAQLGIGLLALGVASNDKTLRTEGRLELLTATLYFTRATGAVPQWLMMIVMVVVAIFFPWVAAIVMLVFLGVYAVARFEIPKLNDDPELLIKHLLMLQKYGLLDEASNALLAQYVAEKGKSNLYNETVAGPYGPGVDNVVVDLGPLFESIRGQLAQSGSEDKTPFTPGTTVPPEFINSTSQASSFAARAAAAIGLGIVISKVVM